MMMDIFSLKGKKPDYQITGYQIWITDRLAVPAARDFMSVLNSAFLAFTATDGYWTTVPE